jgi:hypothetical protein
MTCALFEKRTSMVKMDTMYAIGDGYRRWCQATACRDGIEIMALWD